MSGKGWKITCHSFMCRKTRRFWSSFSLFGQRLLFGWLRMQGGTIDDGGWHRLTCNPSDPGQNWKINIHNSYERSLVYTYIIKWRRRVWSTLLQVMACPLFRPLGINFIGWVCNLLYTYHLVIKWKHFPCYRPFVREIHRPPVNFPHKGQWCGALMFSLICPWTNGWVNSRDTGDLRRHRAHYGFIVMSYAPRLHGIAICSTPFGNQHSGCHTYSCLQISDRMLYVYYWILFSPVQPLSTVHLFLNGRKWARF